MNRHLLLAAVALLLLPDVAQAQAQPNREVRPDRPGGGPGGRPGGGGGRPGPTTRPVAPIVRPVQPGRPGGSGGPQIQPPRPNPGRPGGSGGPQIQPPRPGRPERPDRPKPPVRPGRPQPPHRPGAGRPPQFRPIHRPAFRYPRGYAYRRWTIGLLLPSLFLSSTYYYSDYAALGVGAPPFGYRWVRYGPDLLLVNTRTGRISDVIYGAFY